MGNDPEYISVIISTKGRVDDLGRCIVSILLQTTIPHEIVIIDAGEIPDPECFFEPFRKTWN